MTVRPTHLGLHHVAVFVRDLVAARRFWVDLFGFRVEWEPDPDNLYLTSGNDNLALHRLAAGEPAMPQRLDHLGVFCRDPGEVDAWHAWLVANHVTILTALEPARLAATLRIEAEVLTAAQQAVLAQPREQPTAPVKPQP